MKLIGRKEVHNALVKAGSKNAGNNSVEADIVRLINRYREEDKRPLYVYCNATGSKCGMTAKAYFAKRLKEYKTIEALFFTYKGRRGSAKVKTVKGRKIVAKAVNSKVTQSNYVIATNKKTGQSVYRTEIKDGNKTLVIRDFDEATGETKYIKGDRKTLTKAA